MAAASVASARTYTEAAIGCSNRYPQIYQQGEVMPKSINRSNMVATPDAARNTGSAFNDTFADIDDLFSVQRMAKDRSYFAGRHNASFVIPPIEAEHAQTANEVMAQFRDNKVAVASFFKRIVKNFPSTVYIVGSQEEIAAFDDHEGRKTAYNKLIVGRLNRDAGAVNIREDLLAFYSDIFAVLADEEAARQVAAPVVEKFRTESFVSPYLWWEFNESLTTELLELPGMTNYKARLSAVALERATKIALNTEAARPWATETLTDSFTMSLSGVRGLHEAGMW